jgi:competence protein ComEC
VSLVGLLPALSVLAGTALGLHIDLDPWAAAWAMPPLCVLSMVCWTKHRPRLALALIGAGMVSGGMALAIDARDRALATSVRAELDRRFGGFLIEEPGPAGRHDPVPSRAILVEDASPRDGFVSLRARLTAVTLDGAWRRVNGGITISVSGLVASAAVDRWRAGRAIEAPMTFRRPARYLNDGVPDFERELAFDGVTLLATVKSALLVDVTAHGGILQEVAAVIRAHVRRAVAVWIARHDEVSGAIASAVLIGDRTGLPDHTRETLQAAGTYHVIAISGGNIAILATVATIVLLTLGVRGRKASALTIAVLAAYALIVTTGPSVWRATLMAGLYFAARALDHRTAAWHAASMSAALMLVTSPLDVRDPGFILTFGATLALLEGARIGSAFTPRARAMSWLTASLMASLAVEAALLPVSATLFSRVTAAGLLLNLCAVPLMAVVQIGALVATLADSIPPIAAVAGWAAHLAAQGLVESAGLVTVVPWSTARVPPPGVPLMCVYYAALVAVLGPSGRAVRVCGAAVLLIAALSVVGLVRAPVLGWSPDTQRPLRLTAFDVGQGESMLVETPEGDRILVDTGGTPFGGGVDLGSRVLAPALWARGYESLDVLLLTHGDPDHVGGAVRVLSDFVPGRVWIGVPVPGHRPTGEVLDAAARLRVPVEARRAGEILRLGEVRLRVLHPPEPDWERRRVRNDDSVVVEVVYRDVALLLTGDISAEVERAIVPLLTPARSRILKVAHHGSRSSSSLELLSAWRPQIAIISAGRGNTFGHPAVEVLRRLETIGATVLRTDLDGQITLETDGTEVSVATFLGKVK